MAGAATQAKKPVVRKAAKQARQALKRHALNQVARNEMKSLIKLFLNYIQNKEVEKAGKILSKVVSAIDRSAKKNLIHKKNAAHKKSRMQKLLTILQKSGETPATLSAEKEAKAEKIRAKAKAEKAANVSKAPKAPKEHKVKTEKKVKKS